MAQLLPPQTKGGLPPADYELGPSAAGRRAVTMRVDGHRVYGTLYEPSAETAPGKRIDRKSTRLNSSHIQKSRMPSSA